MMAAPKAPGSWTEAAIVAFMGAIGAVIFAMRKRLARMAEAPTPFDVQRAIIDRLENHVAGLTAEVQALRAENRALLEELGKARADIARFETELHSIREQRGRDAAH